MAKQTTRVTTITKFEAMFTREELEALVRQTIPTLPAEVTFTWSDRIDWVSGDEPVLWINYSQTEVTE